MSELQTLALGFFAGVTILIGLPIGRARSLGPGARSFLNALTIGILLFLVWDVLTHAFEPLNAALSSLHQGRGGLGQTVLDATIFIAGLTVGLGSLVLYERWMAGRGRRMAARFGPGGMETGELAARRAGVASWPAARRLALLIAVGIGLHNFGEGLAIGGSAAAGTISLATLLVIGFALHNATEGFGICAPLAAAGDRPSWGFLLLMGAVAGGPTFLGTAVGRQFTSDIVGMVFLTLAAGSILYVVIQLLGVAHKAGRKEILYAGVLIGLAAGFVTDMVVTAGGA
jgi:zinc transporter, ZIP family